jgi:hypothetical protein
MNIRVEAGPLTIGLISNIVEPTIKVEIKACHSLHLRSTWTCFSLPTPSINGHSLSGINPELVLTGGTTTL